MSSRCAISFSNANLPSAPPAAYSMPAMPPSSRYTGPAMDLANLRSLGVSAVAVECACGRRESIDVSGLPGSIEVPSLRQRLRCTACGARPSDVRPDWSQYRASGMGR